MAQGPRQQRSDHRNKLTLSAGVELKAAPHHLAALGSKGLGRRTNATEEDLASIRTARRARADPNPGLGTADALRLAIRHQQGRTPPGRLFAERWACETVRRTAPHGLDTARKRSMVDPR